MFRGGQRGDGNSGLKAEIHCVPSPPPPLKQCTPRTSAKACHAGLHMVGHLSPGCWASSMSSSSGKPVIVGVSYAIYAEVLSCPVTATLVCRGTLLAMADV
jgi:hypothetical protein